MRSFGCILLGLLLACTDDTDSGGMTILVDPDQSVLDAGNPDVGAQSDSEVTPRADQGLLVDVSVADAAVEFDGNSEADVQIMESDAAPAQPDAMGLDLETSAADQHYLDLWMEQDQGFVSSLRWLPHFIYEQGYVSICIRLEMREAIQLDGGDIEGIRRMIEDGVHTWQRGLVGYGTWPDIPLAEVKLFGVAHTDVVELMNPPDVPLYVNAEAKCPDECSRFHHRDEADPDYADCPRQDVDHFDFTSWYSDFDFGAAGHGGDWGTRLSWAVYQDEVETGQRRVTYHELGHVAGLPDMYLYPDRDEGHRRPRAIMATDGNIRVFDYIMLRQLWDLAWVAYYAE